MELKSSRPSWPMVLYELSRLEVYMWILLFLVVLLEVGWCTLILLPYFHSSIPRESDRMNLQVA